jgi:DNA-binding NarL/FixJ family response regulator
MKTALISEFRKNANRRFEFERQQTANNTSSSLLETRQQLDNVLSTRELMIVQCLSEGKSSIEIANELFISPYTVRTHRKNILSKTGARNVAQLVVLALAHRWI